MKSWWRRRKSQQHRKFNSSRFPIFVRGSAPGSVTHGRSKGQALRANTPPPFFLSSLRKSKNKLKRHHSDQSPTNQTCLRSRTSSSSGAVSDTYLASTSLARLPLGCAARRSVRLGLERHRLSIVSVVLSILSALYGRSKYRAHRAISAQVPGLVDLVLDRLSAQKELAYDDDGEVDTFLFLPHLRDDVLRAVHSISQRERIWKRVKAVIEQNSNVRTGQREGVNGEIGRAWEWIGPSGAGEAGGRRKRIGRRSQSPGDTELGDETPFVDRSAAVHKKWDEPGSRPIY